KIRHALDVVEPSMLRPDAGIIETGGDRVSLVDLAVVVHQEIGAVAVQDARPPARDGGRVQTAREPVTGRFHAVDFDLRFVEKGVEQPHGIRAPTDAGYE